MLKPKGKPKSIFKSLSGFNRVLLLFGLGIPLDEETGKIKVNLRNRIRFLVSLSCAFIASGVALTESEFGSSMSSKIAESGWHYQYQLEVVLVLPLMVFNYIKRNHVEMFVAKVYEFDETLAQMKWIRANSRHSRCLNFEVGLVMSSILLLLLFLLLFGIFIKTENVPLVFVRLSVFVVVTEFYLLISFQFILGTLSIYRRFSVLNTNVR